MATAVRAAGIADAADLTADAARDVEFGQNGRTSINPSRASLPLTHQRSFSMSTTNRNRNNSLRDDHAPTVTYDEAEEAEDGGEADIEWGPNHPCFPHMNPHVPMSSSLYQNTRIIRIKRDWMVAGDLAPTFSNLYPEILDPLLPEDQFRELIKHLNTTLTRIYDPWRARSWIDASMGVLTGGLWDDMGVTGAKKELAQLENYVEEWNREHGGDPNRPEENLRIIPFRRTAYLCLDIQIPDPHIGTELEGDAEDDGRTNTHTHTGTETMSRAFSTRSRSTVGGRTPRAKSTSTRPNSYYSSRASSSRVHGAPDAEGVAPAQPVVPPIPGKYLEEAQQQVERQVQSQQSQHERPRSGALGEFEAAGGGDAADARRREEPGQQVDRGFTEEKREVGSGQQEREEDEEHKDERTKQARKREDENE
ncbi:MAG: hypothetical protein M1831_006052 [Alyxoria varia]|nr:MAG: hypothetical protein M1831_006052 [Alyxoria varia]